MGQGDRCDQKGDIITYGDYQHCYSFGEIDIVYNLTGVDPEAPTDLVACIVAEATGWVAVGWGGTGQDQVVVWYENGEAKGGDWDQHKNAIPDATEDVTLEGPAGEADGVTTVCFTRPLDTGDEEDFLIDVNTHVNMPYGASNTDPPQDDLLIADDEDQNHGIQGKAPIMMSDPTAPLPAGATLDGGLFTLNDALLMGLAVIAGSIMIGGVAIMVKQNRDQTAGQAGGAPPPGMAFGGGHGDYGGYGYGSEGSSRSRSSRGSRGRRSKSSRGRRGGSHGRRGSGGSRHSRGRHGSSHGRSRSRSRGRH